MYIEIINDCKLFCFSNQRSNLNLKKEGSIIDCRLPWLVVVMIKMYLCNQCLSPLKCVSSIPSLDRVYSMQLLFDKSLFQLVVVFSLVFCRFSGFPKQKNSPPWYNWNIVESGINPLSLMKFKIKLLHWKIEEFKNELLYLKSIYGIMVFFLE